ncbi:helix-turn-helix domain-containing protein [Hymenobacter sp. BT770]|uniref:helix-turn-helix domain-containing protein n=1 Tax=Hymenobacter sp. BT770 TaxID=2886942 RepID=UPI001D11F26F|nr:helix-turn-helix domain-containing protein [Hymenobacter sp. BT770]MCC3152759.1 helix-turn-helix domain-containing protein [Hymenobacter sp. BT770]MDO3414834.1 helix-turn-helix domain-containing protein [Hymenobacter sp. BT770]
MPFTPNLAIVADSPESFRDLLRSIVAELFPANTTASPAAPDGLMSKEEVCREFGISSTTLTEWMKKGLIPFLRYDRRVYFERAAILEAGRTHTKYKHSKGK